MRTIRLLAMDLDDTLLNSSNTVSPRAAAAIRRAVAEGVTVTIATGRMYASAVLIARQLELDVPLITYNGAMIKTSMSEDLLLHRPLDMETARAILAIARREGWYIQTYINDRLYVREINDCSRYYSQLSGIEAVAIGEALYEPDDAPTKMLAMADVEPMQEICARIRGEFGDRANITLSKPTFMEVVHPEASKGLALSCLADKLGIPREAVMAVGDSENDVSMIRYAGWGVAMGNARPLVKEAAQAVTTGNDEDGVAEAIEKYVLRNG